MFEVITDLFSRIDTNFMTFSGQDINVRILPRPLYT
jgi:hypothetical protein